jgi:hypothetical protein
MIYDPRENAIDAAKMCFAAQSCFGFKREALLRTAIEEMVKAFDPKTGIQLSDQEITFYSRFVTKAEHSLHLIECAKKMTSVALTQKEFAENVRDAELMFRSAEECAGTRRDHLIETTRWELTRAQDALLNGV